MKTEIAALLKNPTDATWDAAQCAIVSQPCVTLWKAVCAVDPTFPTVGPMYGSKQARAAWAKIPTPALVKKALAYAAALIPPPAVVTPGAPQAKFMYAK